MIDCILLAVKICVRIKRAANVRKDAQRRPTGHVDFRDALTTLPFRNNQVV
jgi:hypothetical protein